MADESSALDDSEEYPEPIPDPWAASLGLEVWVVVIWEERCSGMPPPVPPVL
jgi:hypothetical protein